eukprot:284429_1
MWWSYNALVLEDDPISDSLRRINIVNKDEIDITDPSHLRPQISFTNYPIKHADQRHFLSVTSCAGSTGSNTIVSGSRDAHQQCLYLWNKLAEYKAVVMRFGLWIFDLVKLYLAHGIALLACLVLWTAH